MSNARDPRGNAAGDSAAQEALRSHFLDGWFTRAFDSGERPAYGYPANHLPEPNVESMEIETAFFAARKEK
jgi:hypothetical protein